MSKLLKYTFFIAELSNKEIDSLCEQLEKVAFIGPTRSTDGNFINVFVNWHIEEYIKVPDGCMFQVEGDQ